jgi:hypothetical protein
MSKFYLLLAYKDQTGSCHLPVTFVLAGREGYQTGLEEPGFMTVALVGCPPHVEKDKSENPLCS